MRIVPIMQGLQHRTAITTDTGQGCFQSPYFLICCRHQRDIPSLSLHLAWCVPENQEMNSLSLDSGKICGLCSLTFVARPRSPWNASWTEDRKIHSPGPDDSLGKHNISSLCSLLVCFNYFPSSNPS